MKPIAWTEQQIQFLKENYPNTSVKFCAEKLGLTKSTVKAKAAKLGLKVLGFRINKEQGEYITVNRHLTPTQIAKHLGISWKKVMGYIYRKQLSPVTFTKYSADEIEFLKQNYTTLSWKEIGDAIGRSHDSVKNKAQCLGLSRTKEQSWAIQDRLSTSTRFKKGQLPACTLYDGAISHRTDNGITYRYIRTAPAKWEMLHIINWQKQNGPLPDGMILRCKNGNQLDCRPENWEPVDRATHLELNSGRKTLTDKYIINNISRGDAQLKEAVAQMPGLIELKRNQLKLGRIINECID
jgi:hypothetical protein